MNLPDFLPTDQLSALFDSAPIGIIVHQGGDIHYLNPKVCQIFNAARKTLLQGPVSKLLGNPSPRKTDYMLMRFSGEAFPASIQSIPYQQGSLVYLQDLSEQRELKSELERITATDPLTGLPNRSLLKDRYEKHLLARQVADTQSALIVFDLQRFKSVNDTLGHPVGDKLLQEVAERLQNGIRGRDIIARLGGDEFALFLSETDLRTTTVLAERIHNLMTAPFILAGNRFTLGASIGVALNRDNMTFDELYRRADMAMHRAKHLNGGIHFYDAKADQQLRERAYLEQELRQAIRTGQLQIHYQPILSLTTGRCVTAEALLRWHHPKKGNISPGKFIPLAEETGLISTIDRYVLKQAIIDAKSKNFSVTVNISPKTLCNHNFIPYLNKMLSHYAFEAKKLCLEITEQVLAKPEETLQVIRAAHKLGCCIAVDDFGVGYSSLSYLSQYPLDILKLDRSFTQGAQADPKTAAIAEGILHLAKRLGLRTLAEGIEEEAHVAWLKARNCELGQGFYLIQPKPLEELDGFSYSPILT